eukprot:6323189-Prymnesium_polylepis.1
MQNTSVPVGRYDPPGVGSRGVVVNGCPSALNHLVSSWCRTVNKNSHCEEARRISALGDARGPPARRGVSDPAHDAPR